MFIFNAYNIFFSPVGRNVASFPTFRTRGIYRRRRPLTLPPPPARWEQERWRECRRTPSPSKTTCRPRSNRYSPLYVLVRSRRTYPPQTRNRQRIKCLTNSVVFRSFLSYSYCLAIIIPFVLSPLVPNYFLLLIIYYYA